MSDSKNKAKKATSLNPISNYTGSGVYKISKEREEQVVKHGRSIQDDILHNPNGELIQAARALLKERPVLHDFPESWGVAACRKMLNKSTQERYAIAGALIAAEMDRAEELEKRTKQRVEKKFPTSNFGDNKYYP